MLEMPGLALVIFVSQNVHNIDEYMVLIANCLWYSGLLYLIFWIKEKSKSQRNKI